MKSQHWLVGGALVGTGLLWRKLREYPVSLRNQVVVITGASAGIGRAAAHAFAAEAASIVLAARRADQLHEVAAELAQYGVPVLVVPTDLNHDADLHRLVQETMRAFGRIDVLVNNAGIANGGPFAEFGKEMATRVLRVNLEAPIRLTHLVVPIMLKQRQGHIVNVSSLGGYVHTPGIAVYASTKAGLLAFSNVLRRELQGSGVHVSKVLPALTRTALTDRLLATYQNPSADKSTRVIAPLLRKIDAPEVPAKAIVDAVRYRKPEVILGGSSSTVSVLLEKIAPGLLDAIMARADARILAGMGEQMGLLSDVPLVQEELIMPQTSVMPQLGSAHMPQAPQPTSVRLFRER